MVTHTDLRIRKLALRGLTPEQIARKIGRPCDLARVHRALGVSAPDAADLELARKSLQEEKK